MSCDSICARKKNKWIRERIKQPRCHGGLENLPQKSVVTLGYCSPIEAMPRLSQREVTDLDIARIYQMRDIAVHEGYKSSLLLGQQVAPFQVC